MLNTVNVIKDIEYFRNGMQKNKDYMSMRLPRSFAYSTNQLFGDDLTELQGNSYLSKNNEKDINSEDDKKPSSRWSFPAL